MTVDDRHAVWPRNRDQEHAMYAAVAVYIITLTVVILGLAWLT